MCLNKTKEVGEVTEDLKLHTKASDHLGEQRKTSEPYIPESPSAFPSSTLHTKSEIVDQKGHSKEDSSSTEDPIRQLLYSTSITSALNLKLSKNKTTTPHQSNFSKGHIDLPLNQEAVLW